MVRIKSILLVVVLLILTIAQPQAKAVRNLSVPWAVPDLVILDVSTSDYTTVNVTVKNQGAVASAPCYLWLSIKLYNGGGTKVFSPQVPALAIGQETKLVVKTGVGLEQADYQAKVDRSNTVKEGNENNNTRNGKFGGKP